MNRCCLSLSLSASFFMASSAAAEPPSSTPRKFPILSISVAEPDEQARRNPASRYGIDPIDYDLPSGPLGARQRSFSLSQEVRVEGRPVTFSIGSAKRLKDPVRVYPAGRLDQAGALGLARHKPRGRTLQATARIRF